MRGRLGGVLAFTLVISLFVSTAASLTFPLFTHNPTPTMRARTRGAVPNLKLNPPLLGTRLTLSLSGFPLGMNGSRRLPSLALTIRSSTRMLCKSSGSCSSICA
ncbi:MAG: hypothetical protein EBQ85_11360 [Proteobacteria bacterium]|nr:hypothetical protein [Pseudomonadota bacterium]